MLPRRFALIRHVDYTGAAGTGVIAYGVAFDDGQVVLRWSSAHRATSVLDSVEDLIAAHGHGETTSIEWIDAPPGKSDAPAQAGGRRARRSAPLDDVPPATEIPRTPKQAETAWAKAAETGTAAHEQQEPAPAAESTDIRPAAPAPRAPEPAETTKQPAAQAPPFNEPAATPPAPHGTQAPTPSPADTGHTTAPVPASPPAFAQPAASAQPPAPPVVPPPSLNGATSPNPLSARPVPEVPAAPASAPPTSNGTMYSSKSARRADAAVSGSAEPPPDGAAPERADTTLRADRNGDHRTQDHGAGVIDHAATGQGAGDERRARHEAIATQPMNTDLSEDPGQRRPRRAAAPPRESPRSIFEEVEEPPRPDLRLASSNGRSREPDDLDDSEDTSPGREDFGGYFSPGHQHLDTVTGLLDLPAGLDKRGRGSSAEQDTTASRRNGRHRGE